MKNCKDYYGHVLTLDAAAITPRSLMADSRGVEVGSLNPYAL